MDAFTGMISMFGFNYAPRDWAFCAGQFVGINQYPALYALIGNFYGGDGRITMAMPDFRARSPVGSTVMGASPTVPSTIYPLGFQTGLTDYSLSHTHLPIHNHDATFTPTGGGGGAAVTVDIAVSTGGGNLPTATTGAYLAGTVDGSGNQYATYTSTPVAPVSLGGVTAAGGGGGITGGTVTVHDAGLGDAISIVQPIQAVTFSIMLDGLFPSRN